MQWIALAAACVALIVLTYYSPKIGFAMLSFLAALLIGLYYFNLDKSEIREYQVSQDQVQLSNLNTELSYADNWIYSGRITNSSSQTLTDVELKVKLYDCPATQSEITDSCIVIGEVDEFLTLTVPPRQARDFSDNVYFKNAMPQGKLMWDYEITGTRASE